MFQILVGIYQRSADSGQIARTAMIVHIIIPRSLVTSSQTASLEKSVCSYIHSVNSTPGDLEREGEVCDGGVGGVEVGEGV